MDIEDDLKARSGDACELCGSTEDLGALEVPPSDGTAGTAVYACSTCRDQVSEEAPVEPTHWFGLKDTIWSEHPPVQVLSWRMLDRLRAHSWAADLLDQAWLPEEVMAWAQTRLETVTVVDSNGTSLSDGDAVTLIKDLDVKGANFTAKRGTMVKNIRLGDDPGLVEGKVNGTSIYLKTEFLKKA